MNETDKLCALLDEFEHECFMIRVEASETGAKREVVLKAYERQRDETAKAIAATLGRGECEDVSGDIAEFTCSACKFNCNITSWVSLFDGDDGRHRNHHHGTPNYCPSCGKAVKR